MGRHVFICGYPRSGTTMLCNMLRATVTNFRFFKQDVPAHLVIGSTPDDCVTKRSLDIFDIDSTLAANTLRKEVICIIMIRDLRGIVTSRHVSIPNEYFIGFDHQYRVQDGVATYANPGILQIHARISAAWRRTDLAKIVLRYEEVVRHTEAVQARLGRDLGFQYRGEFRNFHMHEFSAKQQRALNTLRPPDPTNIDAWRAPEHRARIADQFGRCPTLLGLLRSYGYESDDRWFDAYRRDAELQHPA